MRAILPLVALIAGLAACDSPTAPRGFADGSVRFSDLNPQPLPPGLRLATSSLNPQPLPPGLRLATSSLNPQPLPPGLRSSTVTTSACIAAGIASTATRLYEPPDPCLK